MRQESKYMTDRFGSASVTSPSRRLFALVVLSTLAAAPARAEMSAEELAKLAQNPVGNLISVPFQNNTNFNFGPLKGTQNILNIQNVARPDNAANWQLRAQVQLMFPK